MLELISLKLNSHIIFLLNPQYSITNKQMYIVPLQYIITQFYHRIYDWKLLKIGQQK